MIEATDVALSDDTPTSVPLTVDDVLEHARRVERVASICIRGDLQAEWDRLVDELSRLVTPAGELLDDVEAGAGEVSAAGRVEAINDRLVELRREMGASMWHVRFQAMAADDWDSFVKRHKPKDPKADLVDFYNRLIAETALEPPIDMGQIKALRGKLAPSAIIKLARTAHEACTEGGLDVPKLPVSLRNLAALHSED